MRKDSVMLGVIFVVLVCRLSHLTYGLRPLPYQSCQTRQRGVCSTNLLLQGKASPDAISEEGRKAAAMSEALELSIIGLDDSEPKEEPKKKKKKPVKKPLSKDPRDF